MVNKDLVISVFIFLMIILWYILVVVVIFSDLDIICRLLKFSVCLIVIKVLVYGFVNNICEVLCCGKMGDIIVVLIKCLLVCFSKW